MPTVNFSIKKKKEKKRERESIFQHSGGWNKGLDRGNSNGNGSPLLISYKKVSFVEKKIHPNFASPLGNELGVG